MKQRECHTNQIVPRQQQVQANSDSSNIGSQASNGGMPPKADKDKNRGTNTRGNVEQQLRNIKCFGCHK